MLRESASKNPMIEIIGGDDFDADESEIDNKVIRKMDQIKESNQFKIRDQASMSFDPIVGPKLTYFSETGDRQPQNLNHIIDVKTSLNCKGNNKDWTIPVDNVAARDGRLEKFNKKTDDFLNSFEGYDDFLPDLVEGEKLVCTLDCSEISGYPSSTRDDATIEGFIKVSIVEHTTDGLRLFFSVAEGSKDIRLRERFSEHEQESSCIICCVKIQMNGRDISTSTVTSAMKMEYQHKKMFASQFFTLPVDHTLVDSVAYRSAYNEFEALTQQGQMTLASPKKCCSDCNIKCTCCNCDCQIPVCCGLLMSVADRTLSMRGQEHFQYGRDMQKYNKNIYDVETDETNGVTFAITSVNEDYTYVVVHYRSLMDNKNHSCKMRIRKTDNDANDFRNAKKFVSILGSARNKIVKYPYYETHPSMTFAPMSRDLMGGALDTHFSYGPASVGGGAGKSKSAQLAGACIAALGCGLCIVTLQKQYSRLTPCHSVCGPDVETMLCFPLKIVDCLYPPRKTGKSASYSEIFKLCCTCFNLVAK